MKTIYNFTWFLLRLFQNRTIDGGPKVSKEKRNKRLSICENCNKLTRKGFLAKIKGPRCSICGCFVEWKTHFKIEECADTQPKWTIEK